MRNNYIRNSRLQEKLQEMLVKSHVELELLLWARKKKIIGSHESLNISVRIVGEDPSKASRPDDKGHPRSFKN